MKRRKNASAAPCPCGSGRAFAECCGPFLSGAAAAPTPEALMRSRYTAYALGDDAYVLSTWNETTRPAVLFEAGEARPRWISLAVTDAKPVTDEAQTGEVTFTALARTSSGAMRLSERSLFQKKDGRWIYVRALSPDEKI